MSLHLIRFAYLLAMCIMSFRHAPTNQYYKDFEFSKESERLIFFCLYICYFFIGNEFAKAF